MTREELIKAIYDNEDTLSCPEYACDMPEKEGNTGKCCLRCAEKQLKAYEDKIKAEVIDEVTEKYFDAIEDILCQKDLKLGINQALSIYGRIMNRVYEIAEQYKEHNNEPM